MEISSYLDESCVLLDMGGGDKSAVLEDLVGRFMEKTAFANRDAVLSRLLEREQLKTTGIGSGIAIPHCKVPGVERIHLVVGLSREGVEYQSLDGKPAHLFFMVVAPAETCSDHL
ncbi:MAG: PTS sugar transporter subunit IIA, partial [Deltaproteobacteria bacterium]|nr:PTS sugar transporter subunit IIA [Deltaproteobacteria bacterium]